HRAEAEQDVGPQPGLLAAELPLETDGSAEQCGETQLEKQLQSEHLDDACEEMLHQPSASRNPMRLRTWAMVRRAMARALAAPPRSRSVTVRGCARSASARSRMGVSAAIILSASTRLQSRQPHRAVRQLCAITMIFSGWE